MMQISKGIIESAQKVVVYGPEGIGKSTFASQFPKPVFIDTEGSTKHLDISRLPNPSSWSMLLEEVRQIKANPGSCETLVIDTADWAERLCINEICYKYKKEGIEDFGYGKGYVYLEEEFGRLLNLLTDLIDLNINVVFTAHSQMRKFEQPDETGAYDRWEMKLEKKTAPMLKEWADLILFANYKTYVVKTENSEKKGKAQGGKRVMYTTHHPCWDAKNRCDLVDELEFKYETIAHCIPSGLRPGIAPAISVAAPNVAPAISPDKAPAAQEGFTIKELPPEIEAVPPVIDAVKTDLSDIPIALADLMSCNSVTVKEIQLAVARKGYYPEDTPIKNYDPGFISGVLVAVWPQVFQIIKNNREEQADKEKAPF